MEIKSKNEEVPKLFFWFFLASMFSSFVYVFFHRNFDSILHYTLNIWYIHLIGFVLILPIQIWLVDKSKRLKANELPRIIYSIPVLLFFSFFYYSTYVMYKDFFNWIGSAKISNTNLIYISLAVIILFSGLLFYFRLKLRGTYGITEILVGIFIAYDQLNSNKDFLGEKPEYYIAILTASVYLIVRGMDNFHQGLINEKYDPIAKKVWNFLNLSDLK